MPAEIRYQLPIPVGGVRKDVPPNAVAPSDLIDSQNMVMRRGRFQTRYGVTSFAGNTVGATVLGVISYIHSDGNVRLVAGYTTGWAQYLSGTGNWSSITGSALSSTNHIIFRVFQKDGATHLLGINNQVSTMKKWDGTAGTYSDVSGTPPLAKAMMVLANRVLLFNLADNGAYSGVISPCGYDVSAFNDFDSGWGTTLNGLLIDTPGPIMAALEMGDLQGAIYKSDAIIMAIAQSGTVPFHFEWRVINNIGPANQRCVVSVSDGSHIYLAKDGSLNRFDGVSSQSLGFHLQKAILDALDGNTVTLGDAYIFYDNERNELHLHYQRKSPSTRLHAIVNLENMSFWPQKYAGGPTSIDSAGGRLMIPGSDLTEVLVFGTSGQAYKEQPASTDVGANPSVYWESAMLDLGAPGYWKTLNQVDHLFLYGVDDPRYTQSGGSQALTATTRYSDGGEPTADAETGQTITLSGSVTNSYVTDHRGTGKLIGFRYSGSPAAMFEYRGASIVAVQRGER